MFFVAIEVLVRLIFPAKGLDHMIDIGPINLFTKQEINGETWYRISNKNAYSDRNTLFKAKKEKDQVRIICLGGSASAGWPHPPEEIYSRYLEKTLQGTYPEKKIEIINCSAHGFASYRIRQVFETVLPFEPDAVIVWSGNNEFLEGRNYRTSELKNTLIKFRNNFRSLQLVRGLFVEHRYDDTPEVAATFWKKVNQEALELRSDSAQLNKVKAHFETSLSAIVEKAKANHVPVMLMTVPVNLRDWEPNVSWLGLDPQDSIRWLSDFRDGKKYFYQERYNKAIDAFDRAQGIAPLHAETLFWMGKTYEHLSDTASALECYVSAKDLDYNPFRAISDFNDAIRGLSSDDSGVVLLDMERIMNRYSGHGIPGFDLFLDYVHPTREGNLIIAREATNLILRNDLLSIGTPKANGISLAEVRNINQSDYSEEEDMFLQFTRFSLCCMTHQYLSALEFGKLLKKKIPPDAFRNDPSGRMTLLEDAITTFQAYADLERKIAFEGVSPEEERKVTMAIKAFYTKHFPYGAF